MSSAQHLRYHKLSRWPNNTLCQITYSVGHLTTKRRPMIDTLCQKSPLPPQSSKNHCSHSPTSPSYKAKLTMTPLHHEDDSHYMLL